MSKEQISQEAIIYKAGYDNGFSNGTRCYGDDLQPVNYEQYLKTKPLQSISREGQEGGWDREKINQFLEWIVDSPFHFDSSGWSVDKTKVSSIDMITEFESQQLKPENIENAMKYLGLKK